jgi:hypothetical protein
VTPTVEQNLLGDLVLNKEKEFMKFHKDIVITNKAINRKKVLANVRDMKDIMQAKG